MSMSDKTKAAKPRKAQTEKKMSPALSVGDVKTQFEDGDGACVRARSLCWNDCFTKAIDDLREEKRSAGASGVLKDYEWRFEYESRLAVELAEDVGVDCDRIAVEVPKDVLAKMTFTRSPWVDYEKRIADALRDARVGRAMKPDFIKPSVLSGALEKWRSK